MRAVKKRPCAVSLGATDDRAVKKGAGTRNFQPNYLAERLATVGNEAKKAKHTSAGRASGP